MTNFEKIKNMSVEELAKNCCASLKCAFCPIAEFCEQLIRDDIKLINCIKVWKQWLKSEVEE